MRKLIILNEEINDIIKITKSLERNDVSNTIKNQKEEQRGGLLGILLIKSGARLSGNMLAGKVVISNKTT